MEIINVNLIMLIIVLVFFVSIIITFVVIPIVKPIWGLYKLNYLSKILNQRPDRFMSVIEKCISKAKNDEWRSILLFTKIAGITRIQNWDKLKSTVDLLDLTFLPSSWLGHYCKAVITLYLLDRIEEGRSLTDKLKIIHGNVPNHHSYETLVFTVCDYYDGKFEISKFHEILSSVKLDDFGQSVVYYFLGVIEKNNSNVTQSKLYFEKAKTYDNSSYVFKKSEEALNLFIIEE